MRGFTVAIDGPAASGKGISRAVAAHFGFAHLDTGLLYRPWGGGCWRARSRWRRRGAHGDLEGDGLRDEAVGGAASKVAAIPEVREALVDFQRAFATGRGAVLDGRDIGTVICPDAQVKLYVVASDEVRAERRWRELTGKGQRVTKAEVLADLRERDARDSARATAPLRPAEDAITLDTTTMSIEEAVAAAVAAVEAKRSGA